MAHIKIVVNENEVFMTSSIHPNSVVDEVVPTRESSHILLAFNGYTAVGDTFEIVGTHYTIKGTITESFDNV